MADRVLKMVIQLKRGTTAEWLAHKDMVPAAGEPCFDLELFTLKIGDGKTTYGNLPTVGDVKVSADGKSLVLEDDVFKLAGFDAAEIGAQPRKNADGNIEWVVPSTETVDGLKDTVAGLKSDVSSLQTSVADLQEIVTPSGEGVPSLLDRVESLESKMDGDGEDSVDAKVDAKLNEFASQITDNGTVDTFVELVDYVANHAPEAANMAADIVSLKELVGEEPVGIQVEKAVEEVKSTTKAINYEVSSKPAGTLVNYREKEIRIMCPSTTKWTLQTSGENADANTYYVGFKAYAPENAVSFKEDLNAIIADSAMYYFENNEFAGVDKYDRKYSIVWLPVARYDASTDTWTYYGKSSSNGRYIGWYYSVEWYDANGSMIDSDTIRINLTNEQCHNYIEPYYMSETVKKVSVNGTLLDMVDGQVNIVSNNIVKSSDEITVADDGTLIINTIDISKIIQGEGTLVLDGGSAID